MRPKQSTGSADEDPYDALDVDPIGKYGAKKRNGCYRMTIPVAALRADQVPLEEASVGSGDTVVFRMGVSKEVPGRLVLDLDRDQLPSPPERR